MRERARRLALTLLELGEDLETTERQLHRWRFHPAVAYEAVRWAQQERVLAAAERASSSPDGSQDLGRRNVPRNSSSSRTP
jgi:hypothetical protein